MKTLLRDSALCRLCAEDSPNGVKLFDEKTKVNELVNKYLPLTVYDDGYLPLTICQGCHIHLQDIVLFHDLIKTGQKKIEILREKESEYHSSLENINVKTEEAIIFVSDDIVSLSDVKTEGQIDILEIQRAGNDSNQDENQKEDEPTEAVVKRKRGRPKKTSTSAPISMPIPQGRSVRIRKQPNRYSEMFHGQELENALIKENVPNETDGDDNMMYEEEVANEASSRCSEVTVGVIGWIQTKCGKTLGNVITKKKDGGNIGCVTRLQCIVCKKDYSQKGVLLRHLLKDRCGPPGITVDDIICPTFNITTTEQEMNLLNTDIEVSGLENLNIGSKSKKKYICLLCQKSFPRKCGLVYHEEKEHTHHIFTCSTCNKPFKHRLLLMRHQKSHDESRPYVCDICSLSFKYLSNLNLHRMSHTSRGRYICSFCSALFTSKSSLEIHIRVHLGYKPFECNICQKRFSQKNNLLEHLRIHSGEKPFKCSCCLREFKTSSQLRTHMLIHSEIKPFNCEICSKSFRHKDSFSAHIRRHTGEKPYNCTHCGKSFLEGTGVRKHERMHTGEKRFCCRHCDKPFADCSNLSKHRKKVHGDGVDSNLARVIYLNLDLPDQDLNNLDLGNINDETNTNSISALNLALGNCESEMQVTNNALQSKSMPLVFKSLNQQGIKHKGLNLTLSDIQNELDDADQLSVPIVLKSLHSSVNAKDDDHQLPMFSAENMPLVLKSLEESTRGKDMPLVLDSVSGASSATESLRLALSNSQSALSHDEDRDSLSLALSNAQSQIQELKDLSGLVESSRQIVTDSQGVPIKITLPDGTQLQVTTTDGETLEVITNDGVPLPVRLSGPPEYVMSQTLPNIDALTMEGALNDISHLGQDYEIQFVDRHNIKLLSSSSEQSIKLLSSSPDDQSIKLLTSAAHAHGIHLLETSDQAIKLLPPDVEDIKLEDETPEIALLSADGSSNLKLLSSSETSSIKLITSATGRASSLPPTSSRSETDLFMSDCHSSNIIYNPDPE